MAIKTKLSIEENEFANDQENHISNENVLENTNHLSHITQEQQEEMIAKAAYYKAEKRNFEPGYDMEDWLNAEADIYGLVN